MTEKFRHWVFTLNNYTDDDITKLRQTAPKCKYLVYGKEVGDAGTPHLQGFVSFFSQRKATALHKWFSGRAYWKVARDLVTQSVYCKKDGDFEEFGVSPNESSAKQGRRNDLEALRDAINQGESDRKKLRQAFPGVCAKYPNFVSQLLLDQIPAPELQVHPLRAWQSSLCEILRRPPDHRTIYFVVDTRGDSGKSWFCRYYESVYGRSVTLIPGKKADMVYAFLSLLKKETKVVFVDAPRSKQGEFIQYDFLEELKNGRLFNTKYESRMFEFAVPHVVVMMNEEPDREKLSADRIHVVRV